MGNKKILIVEDDPDVRQGMYVRLKANHYDVFFAVDALSSMAEARKHEPDLIILDLGLPAGDGFVVMERLKGIAFLAVIPVIVVSRSRRSREQRARPQGGGEGLSPKASGQCGTSEGRSTSLGRTRAGDQSCGT
jgi:CheY-like chemotaxis protein